MFLNQRSIAILKRLIQFPNDTFEIEELASHFEVSERTIRNDLESIDFYLKTKKLPRVRKEMKIQISLDNSELTKEDKISLLHEVERSDQTLTASERKDWIFIESLLQMTTIDIQYLMDLLQVSRSTVISDIRVLKEELLEKSINLEYKPQQGYHLTGNEWLIRREGISILSSQNFLTHYLEERILEKDWLRFSEEDFKFVGDVISDIEKKLKKIYSDNAYRNLTNGVLLSISRMQEGRFLEPVKETDALKNKEYTLLTEKAHKLEDCFQINVPDQEVWFLVNLFIEGNLIKSEHFLDENWVELYLFTNRFIEEMSRQLAVPLHQDQDLFTALVLHLGPALNRMENEVFLKNEILQQIQETYPELFDQVGTSLNTLSAERDILFSTNEIGFMTLHIAAALEKISMMGGRPNVLLICNYGIGTSKLLETRINKFFAFHIAGTFSIRELNEELLAKNDIDLIVSTLPIKKEYHVPVIEVSPLLNGGEIQTLKDYERSYFSNRHHIKEATAPKLSSLLTTDTVQTNVDVQNWEDAIRFGGQLLKDRDAIEQRYIEEMIRAVKELGNYVVITSNVAMPHASPDKGVKEIGMSLITLKEAVPFGDVESDRVQIVICLAAVDSTSHLHALQALVDYLNDEPFMKLLTSGSSKEEIIEYINEEDMHAE
ncbi:BglG family transcription antiterminator [Jeotgalibaca caeni]|uniref:BglG family transcription antiterminator n=1 Tax=Jeotgalibaca caeni TaxID=3028623 RepID=UPI00237EAFA4|nr:BglG family transcription antiterminator [Jeotgalibaca caeni]MDE1549301.1 BglG family transcription antiterminator [Jeotgalibaca caeni]